MLTKPILWGEKLAVPVVALPLGLGTVLRAKYPQKPAKGKAFIYMFLLYGGVYIGRTATPLAERTQKHLKTLNSPVNTHYQGGHGLPEILILAEVDKKDASNAESQQILKAIKKFGRYRVYNYSIGFSDSEGYCAICDQILPRSAFGEDKSKSSGQISNCKPCQPRRAARQQVAHPLAEQGRLV